MVIIGAYSGLFSVILKLKRSIIFNILFDILKSSTSISHCYNLKKLTLLDGIVLCNNGVLGTENETKVAQKVDGSKT